MENILDDLWKSRHEKDVLFLSIIEGYTLKVSADYPDSIFYTKGESVLIDYELKTKYTWINYHLIWSVFESKFSLNYEEIKELLKGVLETHLKLKGTTPESECASYTSSLETHLKLKGTTSVSSVSISEILFENHFKLKGHLFTTPLKYHNQ